MKTFLRVWILVALWAAAAPGTAEAQVRGGFGIGLSLGEPTGITMEFGTGGRSFASAFELTIGLETVDDDPYAHFLWKVYLAELARTGALAVPIYTGIGPFVADGNRSDEDDLRIGARAPFGVALAFRRVPLHIFFEVALQFEIVSDLELDVDGAVGFRWFF